MRHVMAQKSDEVRIDLTTAKLIYKRLLQQNQCYHVFN